MWWKFDKMSPSVLTVCLSYVFLVHTSLAQPQRVQLGGGSPRPVALGTPISGPIQLGGPYYTQELSFGPPQYQHQPQPQPQHQHQPQHILSQSSPTQQQLQQYQQAQAARLRLSQNQPIVLKQSSLPLQGQPSPFPSFPGNGGAIRQQQQQQQQQPLLLRSPAFAQQIQSRPVEEEEYEDEEYEEEPQQVRPNSSPRPVQFQQIRLQPQSQQQEIRVQPQQQQQQYRLVPQPQRQSAGPGPQRFIIPQQQAPQPQPTPQQIRRPVSQRIIQQSPAPTPAPARVQPQVQYEQTRQPSRVLSASQNALGQDNRLKNRVTTPAPVQTIDRYMRTNQDGSITWGYQNEDGTFKEETIGVDCVVRGKYGYVDPDGTKREYEYQQGNPCDPNKKDQEELEEEEEEEDAPSSQQKLGGILTARPGQPRRPVQQQQIYRQ